MRDWVPAKPNATYFKPRPVHPCVLVHDVCFEAEQILLAGKPTTRRHSVAKHEMEKLNELLGNAKHPWEYARYLHPEARPTVRLSSEGNYTYLPLIMFSGRAAALAGPSVLMTHTPSPTPRNFSGVPALAYFSTWPMSFVESFIREATRLYELQSVLDQSPYLIPAMMSPQFESWVRPFTNQSIQPTIEPLAFFPDNLTFADQLVSGRAGPASYASYTQESLQYQAQRRGPRCFRKARVCDFTYPPPKPLIRPWLTMQAVVQRLGLSDGQSVQRHLRACEGAHSRLSHGRPGECPLRIIFALRRRRRKLTNVDELVSRCDSATFSVGDSLFRIRASCSAIELVGGLEQHAHLLAKTDVFISPHGADMINGLALHAGASVIELMPNGTRGCPCEMYQTMFTSPLDGPAPFYYRLQPSTDANQAIMRARRNYNMDISVPWEAIQNVLDIVTHVNGLATRRRSVSKSTFTY